jgi:hypothetical protein
MNATVKDVMSTHGMAVREIATFKEIATRLREQRVRPPTPGTLR